MRLNLEQLRTFVQVARSGGIGRAAEVLRVTQPAVTARIRALETQIGAPLFRREARGVALTKRGEMLLRHARHLDALLDTIERDVVEADAVEGLLRVGASETIAQTWLPDLVAALHGRFPRLGIELDVDVTVALRERLLDGRLDLALLLGPLSHPEVDNAGLPDVPLAWCVAPGRAGGDPRDLFGLPVATFSRLTRPFRDLVAALDSRVGPGRPVFPSASLSAGIRLVERGLCVGALPLPMVEEGVSRGSLERFDPGFALPPLRFAAAWRIEPADHVVAEAARLARTVAIDFGDASTG